MIIGRKMATGVDRLAPCTTSRLVPPRVTSVFLTAAAFSLGYCAARFVRPIPAIPPPPSIALVDERPPDGVGKKPIDRAKIIAEIDALRPQITAYCLRVEEIEADFRQEFIKLLTPEQARKFEANQKKFGARPAGNQTTKSIADRDIERERDRSLNSVYWLVTITPKLAWLSKEYRLDAKQQTKTRALLAVRRNAFLALLDGTTHPSLRLSRVAQMVDRIRDDSPE